jgi:flagellar basal-body rod modification protein FlgD
VSTSNISSVNSAASTDQTSAQATDKSRDSLGQDAFLQLLTTQLAHQDPLQPQDNQAYIAQLAQFASLEQMTQMNQNIQALVALVAMQQTSNASSADTSATGDSAATADGTSPTGGN